MGARAAARTSGRQRTKLGASCLVLALVATVAATVGSPAGAELVRGPGLQFAEGVRGISIDDTGDLVAFTTAETLVPADVDEPQNDDGPLGGVDLYTYRRSTDTLTLVTGAAYDAAALGRPTEPILAGGGGWVVVTGDNEADPSTVALIDLATGEPTPVGPELPADGVTFPNGAAVVADSISDDGGVVTFRAYDVDTSDAYVGFYDEGVELGVDRVLEGADTANATIPVIARVSGDGSTVAFVSDARDVVAADPDPDPGPSVYVLPLDENAANNGLRARVALPADALPIRVDSLSDDGQRLAVALGLAFLPTGVLVVDRTAGTAASVTDVAGTAAALGLLDDAGQRVAVFHVVPFLGPGKWVVEDLPTGELVPVDSLLATRPGIDDGGVANRVAFAGTGSAVVLVSSRDQETRGPLPNFFVDLTPGFGIVADVDRFADADLELVAATAAGTWDAPTLSGDGDLVAFVGPDAAGTNGRGLYVRNRVTDTTTRLLSATAGFLTDPVLSADGRYVGFLASDDAFVTGTGAALPVPAGGAGPDVYRFDRSNGQLTLRSFGGAAGADDVDGPFGMSADGATFAWADDDETDPNAVVHQLRVAFPDSSLVDDVDDQIDAIDLSADGRRIVVGTSGLEGNDPEVLLLDRDDVLAAQTFVDDDGRSNGLAGISDDGDTVVTSSYVLDPNEGPVDVVTQIFALGAPGDAALLVDEVPDARPASRPSADGSTVVLDPTNLAPPDPGRRQFVRYERATGLVRFLFPAELGNPDVVLSADGATVARGTVLPLLPTDTDATTDVYARDLRGRLDDPVLDVGLTASPTTLPAPGGLVRFTVTVGLTGDDGAATLTSLEDSVAGDLLDPDNGGVLLNTCPTRFADPELLAPTERTCSFFTLVFGLQGTYSRTVTATAEVDALGEVAAAAVGDELVESATYDFVLTAPTGGGTTGGTTGGSTTGGTTGGTTGSTTGGTTGSTTGGATAGTTGGTGSATTGGTGATTSTSTSTSSTTTTVARSTTTVAGATTTAPAVTTSLLATTTTAKVAGAGLPKTGSDTGRLALLALALLGVGLIASGESRVRAARR